MKSFPNIACRELVSEALGAPLERVPSAQVMAAWEESGDLPYGVSLEKYDDDTWDCFAVAGFLVEAAVSYDDLDRKWALKLRAVPEHRWAQLTHILSGGPSWARPLARIAPTLRHPLFHPDWAVRHRGGAWGRETTREFASLDEATVRTSAASWSAQFVEDLARADRWIKGEHRDSDALTSDTWFRLRPPRLGMSIYAAPRDKNERPTFQEAFGRLDRDLSSVRRTGPLGWIPNELPNTWSVEQTRSGQLLEFHVAHFDMLTEKDVAATADVLDRMQSEFWIYELHAMGPYTGGDLREFWRQWLSDDLSTEDVEDVALAVDLQLVIAPRGSGSLDEVVQRLDETVTMREEGAFAELVANSTVCHVEEAATGDALLIELPQRVSQEAISEIEELLARTAGRFDVYETRTTDVFDQEALETWWREARDG